MAGRTLADYPASMSFNFRWVTIEHNGEIIPKRLYGETVLTDGDTLEIMGLVGDG